jgi:cyclic pyranopterin phosphate synthase
VSKQLSHLDGSGKLKMVDVGQKKSTERIAIAKGQISMKMETLALICDNGMPKGDVLTVSQLAGVMGAKRTADLIPLCHPLPLSFIDVKLEVNSTLPGINITAEVKNVGQTGVEMEALTAVSIAALTVYDMIKAVDKSMIIGGIKLVEKHGGKSGDIYNE